MKPTGMHAMDLMRIEKAFRHWGHDIGTHDTDPEAGPASICDLTKDFIGKAAVLKQKGTRPQAPHGPVRARTIRRCCSITMSRSIAMASGSGLVTVGELRS